MKNKKGITLIELMITIAVFGILCAIPTFRESLRQFKFQEEHLYAQENVFLFRTHLRTLLKNAHKIETAFDRELVTDNFKLVVSKDRSKVLLNGKIWELGSFVLGDFEKLNDRTALCKVTNGNNKYILYFILGGNKSVAESVKSNEMGTDAESKDVISENSVVTTVDEKEVPENE